MIRRRFALTFNFVFAFLKIIVTLTRVHENLFDDERPTAGSKAGLHRTFELDSKAINIPKLILDDAVSAALQKLIAVDEREKSRRTNPRLIANREIFCVERDLRKRQKSAWRMIKDRVS